MCWQSSWLAMVTRASQVCQKRSQKSTVPPPFSYHTFTYTFPLHVKEKEREREREREEKRVVTRTTGDASSGRKGMNAVLQRNCERVAKTAPKAERQWGNVLVCG